MGAATTLEADSRSPSPPRWDPPIFRHWNMRSAQCDRVRVPDRTASAADHVRRRTAVNETRTETTNEGRGDLQPGPGGKGSARSCRNRRVTSVHTYDRLACELR